MVQICFSCYEQHSNMAEGNSPAVPVVCCGTAMGSYSGSAIDNADYGMSMNSAAAAANSSQMQAHNSTGGGRFTPSEKSVATISDSMNNVRFKVSKNGLLSLSLALYFQLDINLKFLAVSLHK